MKRISNSMMILLVMLAIIPGCSPKATSFVRQDVDYSFIRRVAVYPFKNLTQDIHANQRVYSIFIAQLLDREAVEVVEYGEVLSAMSRMQVNTDTALSSEQIMELGRILSVDGIFFGSVEEYGVERVSKDRTYSITASYSLAETQTGMLVWNAQTRSQGSSLWRKLFGGGSASLYSVSGDNVNKALETLF